MTTKASEHFLERSEAYHSGAHAAFKALEPPPPILGDADEWGAWDAVGDPVLHIEVRMGRRFVRITRIGYWYASLNPFRCAHGVGSLIRTRHALSLNSMYASERGPCFLTRMGYGYPSLELR